MLAAADRGIRRPLVALPTGAGKTIVFAEVIRRRGGRALVLAHRDELITQAADKLRLVWPGVDVGVVKARRDETAASVVVASVQTLGPKRLATLPTDFSTVVVDEAHHAAAPSYRRILQHVGAFGDRQTLTVGVTATPERGDGVGLNAVFQEIAYRRSLVSMVAEGYLSDLRAVQVRLATSFDGLQAHRDGDFDDDEVAAVLLGGDGPRRAVAAYLEHARGRTALVFTPTVEVAHRMAEAFEAAGVRSEALDGSMPTAKRREILQRLRLGETLVVPNCAVLTEGFDEPSVSCVILARPTRSRPLYLQQVGRGTRLHPGKSDCLVIDLVGSTTRHDLVTATSLFGIEATESTGSLLETVGQRRGLGLPVVDELGHELVSIPIELFRRLRWVNLEDGRFVLSLGNSSVILKPQPDGWTVIRQQPREMPRVLARAVSLEWAQGIAEEEVRAEQAQLLVAPDAPWRKRPPSDKQVAALRRRKLAVPETRGEAADVLVRAFAGSPR